MKKANGALKIESGIAMPEGTGQFSKMLKAMREMKVGESFLLPIGKRNGIFRAAKDAGIKVSSRGVDDEHVRVWRTE